MHREVFLRGTYPRKYSTFMNNIVRKNHYVIQIPIAANVITNGLAEARMKVN